MSLPAFEIPFFVGVFQYFYCCASIFALAKVEAFFVSMRRFQLLQAQNAHCLQPYTFMKFFEGGAGGTFLEKSSPRILP